MNFSNKQFKYFSTFSGIGGFELGIQRAYESNFKYAPLGNESEQEERPQGRLGAAHEHGIQLHPGNRPAPLCVGYSEIDKYATQIYQKHFDHKQYGDITKINETELPDFDMLVGGFPCQSFSIAGKRGGFSDTRGTMFFELARILKHKKPRLFLFENVKGLLSHDEGRTFNTIIATLDELGYDLQWQVLNSKNHGVPQNRERVLIVGHLRGTARPQVFPLGANNESDIVLPTLTTRYYEGQANGGYIGFKTEQVNSPKHSNDRVYADTGISPTLNTMQGGRRQPKVVAIDTRQMTREIVPRISDDVPTLNATMHKEPYSVSNGVKVRRLTPTECERLQGFPDGWTEEGVNEKGEIVKISDTRRYHTLGNAVTTNVIQAVMERIFASL